MSPVTLARHMLTNIQIAVNDISDKSHTSVAFVGYKKTQSAINNTSTIVFYWPANE